MQKKFEKFAAYAVAEAKAGNPDPLIFRFLYQRGSLSEGEIAFIVEVLEAKAGKRVRDEDRKIESYLMAGQVKDLMDEAKDKGKKIKQDDAVDAVVRDRRRSRRTVFSALKEHRRD